MKRNIITAIIITMLLASIVGCSMSTPIEPAAPADRMVENESRQLWGYYRIAIDLEGPTVDVVPLRQAMKHFNVKAYVNPPKCNDCLTVTPTGPYTDNVIPVDIKLKNPEVISGYDVRGTLLSDDEGAGLINPDNHTKIFDNGGPININPFKAFAKAENKREFKPDASHTEHYEIYITSFGKIAVIDYAVDASWPGRAKEPYQIDDPVVEGEMDNFGQVQITINVDVHAAGNDVDEVLLDVSSLGYPIEKVFDAVSGTTFQLKLQNANKMPPGDYVCLLRASTESNPRYLYHYFTLNVIDASLSLANDVQPLFNSYCIGCHTSPVPPLDLDLTSGNAYSNMVEVVASQTSSELIAPGEPAVSYLLGKIRNMHTGFPFLGSGDQMPKNGPPYLTTEEESVVEDWIIQGALDN
jgi:hypothetical protein